MDISADNQLSLFLYQCACIAWGWQLKCLNSSVISSRGLHFSFFDSLKFRYFLPTFCFWLGKVSKVLDEDTYKFLRLTLTLMRVTMTTVTRLKTWIVVHLTRDEATKNNERKKGHQPGPLGRNNIKTAKIWNKCLSLKSVKPYELPPMASSLCICSNFFPLFE